MWFGDVRHLAGIILCPRIIFIQQHVDPLAAKKPTKLISEAQSFIRASGVLEAAR